MPRERFERIKEFVRDKEMPCLVLDMKNIERQFDTLQTAMPYATIYYAIKANPHEAVLRMLIDRECCFDFASIAEMETILRLGARPDRLSYGNTIKKSEHVACAYAQGVRMFATDSEDDLRRIARKAPGSRVFFRLFMECSGADWALSRKFGAHPDTIYQLIQLAKELDVDPWGLSFHVGSQQRDIGQWGSAIASCRYLFDAAQEVGVQLKMINLGGGFPARYVQPTVPLEVYTKEITRFLTEDFPSGMPEIIAEPGRSLVGNGGVLVSQVILKSKKDNYNPYSWLYMDVGKFGGLYETIDESIKYPIYSEKDGPAGEYILAGPTCDSMDVLYEREKVLLPQNLVEGDRLYFLSAGAYVHSCSLECFNGFNPPKVYVFDKD
ncbi:MAG: ornithine decarboxylase [Dethiosulfovibrio peptidovorans]|nr:MAG: ornithine decarboxylase [Dethiosulfovibrio peptidovorans]